jgi:hypothetical protein
MVDETKQVEALMGPYRGKRLTMPAADADAAINAHWAIDPFAVVDLDHEAHPPLTDEERAAALTAATTWAQAQWDAAQGVTPPDPPPPEGGVMARDMSPDESGGGSYRTRGRRG